jgi:hypothetical protein
LNLILRQQTIMEESQKRQGLTQNISREDPGIMESIGSFPVWMLKIIDIITPDFLIKKAPPRKNKP